MREYCRMPQKAKALIAFHIEHIVSRRDGLGRRIRDRFYHGNDLRSSRFGEKAEGEPM
jgi:hypothetical protein